VVLYKVLDASGCSCNGGELKWSLPTKNDDGSWTPGEWMPEIEGPLVECRNGYHLATLEQLLEWLDARIFVAEVGGEHFEASERDKWVARRVRLLSETAWDERRSRLFAADCAERVLHIYESRYPGDSRVRECIDTARRYANGQATMEELDAAGDAAWDAVRTAARDAVRTAARASAGAAAGDAAWAAAAGAARAAAGDAAGAARAARDAAGDAAWAAAGDAAGAARAARDAAGDAAWAAEREWQAAKLAEYLNEAVRA